jgi:hypothetical protein
MAGGAVRFLTVAARFSWLVRGVFWSCKFEAVRGGLLFFLGLLAFDLQGFELFQVLLVVTAQTALLQVQILKLSGVVLQNLGVEQLGVVPLVGIASAAQGKETGFEGRNAV